MDPSVEKCEVLLEVAGYRYYARSMSPGKDVELKRAPTSGDSKAMGFFVDGELIGYVNRLKAKTFHRWSISRTISCVGERLNGADTRPRAFVFVTVRPK